MKGAASERAHSDRRVRAEAAAWLARLHGPDRTRDTESGLRRWLAEHPAHAAEFERATDVWTDTGGVPFRLRRRFAGSRGSRRRRRFGWSVAAGLAASLAIALWARHVLARTIVSTGAGEQKTIELADGSWVTLDTNSRIVVRYGRGTRRVILRYGEAYFQVVHNPGRPFVVLAGNRKVIDLGTSFVVRRGKVGATLTVTVIKGRVAVAPLDVADRVPKVSLRTVLLVTAGTRLLLRPHAPPTLRAEPAAQATAWLRDELIFNNTPLAVAARHFNRYNRCKIILGASQLQALRVGGVFRLSAAKSFVRSVAEAHHLRLIARRDTWILEPRTRVPDGTSDHRP